jgi:hypothetical protein
MYFIYRKNKAFAELQDITSVNFTLEKIEKIVDLNFEKTQSNVDINDTNFEGSEDVVYNENNLLILLGDLKEKCIRYGTGKKWCISRKDTSNMFFSYRMRLEEPVFYFVFDKEKPTTDKYHAIVIYINNKGKYMVANANNEGDEEMTWSNIESIQPKLKGLQDLFKHIPLTQQERQDYEKFKNPVSDSVYEKYNYTEREKYIGFGHDLTEKQIRMTFNVPNQKALISKYVTTGFGTNLPKDIESKLSPSDRAKNTAAKREYIEKGYYISDKQFESCNDDLKREYIKQEEANLSDSKFELCNDDLKREYIEKKIEKGDVISDSKFGWCDDDLKRKYVETMIEKRYIISDKQFELCNDDLKREYVEKRIEKGRKISDKQFELCNDDLKREYIEKRIEKGYLIPDKQFEWCDNDLKREYVEKMIEKGHDIPKYQRQWAKENNLLESTKLIYLLKQSILEKK